MYVESRKSWEILREYSRCEPRCGGVFILDDRVGEGHLVHVDQSHRRTHRAGERVEDLALCRSERSALLSSDGEHIPVNVGFDVDATGNGRPVAMRFGRTGSATRKRLSCTVDNPLAGTGKASVVDPTGSVMADEYGNVGVSERDSVAQQPMDGCLPVEVVNA